MIYPTYVVSARGLGHIAKDNQHTLCGQEIRKEWDEYEMLRFHYLCRRCETMKEGWLQNA
jgi:hypothetical protein